MQGKERLGFKDLFGNGKADAPPADTPAPDDPADIDPGPCASVPRHRHVTALEIRHAKGPWEAFLYRDMGTRAEYEPTRFVVTFEGREQRYTMVVKGRNLHGIYSLIVQGRLEWLQAAARDFAEDGQPVVLSVEVVAEEVRG